VGLHLFHFEINARPCLKGRLFFSFFFGFVIWIFITKNPTQKGMLDTSSFWHTFRLKGGGLALGLQNISNNILMHLSTNIAI